jgi:hypothetical protein
MLQNPRFRRIFPSVFCTADLHLDDHAMITAAKLALPEDARVSHASRLRLLGLDLEPLLPIHLTIGRELHLDIEGINLHRTVKMPASGPMCVSPGAALVQIAASRPRIDVVAIGDWLLHHGHAHSEGIVDAALRDRWRPGAAAVLGAVALMNPQARSLPESRLRCIVVASGLPEPEVNADILEEGVFLACGDLVFRRWRLVAEYEGRQHAESSQQFQRDIERYAALRAAGWEYVQITAERLARPRTVATLLHAKLAERGYEGPEPRFGAAFRALFSAPERRWINNP